MEIPKIIPPITIKESDNYMLIIQDANGVYHYFDMEGNYDGHSYELIPHVEDNPN